MFYEYALDPGVLTNWDTFRYFVDAFGPWKGRFLAEYPSKWKRKVYEGLNCPDLQKKKIETRLASLDKRIFVRRSGAVPYDPTKPWLDSAEAEHQRMAFRAIISAQTRGKNYILEAAGLSEDDPLWRVDSGSLVRRDATALVASLQLLLRVSSRVALIDPYFNATQHEKTQPLAAICELLKGAATTIEVHFSDEHRGYALSMSDAERALPKALPEGTRVRLHCWRPRPGGQRHHNRYLLTEIGGIQFGDSIEQGEGLQDDRLSILDKASWEEFWKRYLGDPSTPHAHYTGDSPAFDAAGAAREFVGEPPRRR